MPYENKKRPFVQARRLNQLFTALLLSSLLHLAQGQDSTSPKLNGVGLVQSGTTTGIWAASLAGGAEIFIYGDRLSMTAASNYVLFTPAGTNVPILAPTLSNDNVFSSNTGIGKLQYTTPALSTLFGLPMDSFDSVDTMQFTVTVQGLDSSGLDYNSLVCSSTSYCQIRAQRAYTPVLYYFSPPVVYHGAMTGLSVDPKWSTAYQLSGDWPFTEARIDNHTIDFQDTVNGDTVLSGYYRNQILGMVGDQLPANSSSYNIKFATGFALTPSGTNTHCNYDNSSCYQLRTVAKIDSISAQAGYTSGGQPLTLTGFGFNGNVIDIKIDGVPCAVTTQSQTQVTCLTGAAASSSVNDTDTVGQHGLRRRIYNNTAQTYMTMTALTTFGYSEVLAMHSESAWNNATYYGNVYSGWFKAPATSNYKFYMACDDQCELRLSSTNLSSQGKSLILSNTRALAFRDYWEYNGALNTTWIPLVEDNYYFIEAKHVQMAGAESVSVAVEIQDSVVEDHPNSMREVQRLLISPTILRDLINITVTNPDSGSYTLRFLNPGTTTYTSSTFACSASASAMASAVAYFFSSNWGATISVTKTMIDSTGATTTSASLSAKSTWQITVNKALASASVTLSALPLGTGITTATIQVLLPSQVQVGNPPISGRFKIQCFNTDGSSNYTSELATTTTASAVQVAIEASCSEYRDLTEVWEGATYGGSGYYADGRDIFVRFAGVNADVPQFIILSGTQSPIVADSPQFLSQTPTPYGGSLFYAPIPFELLYTNETMPQVIMTIDTLPAVCAGLSCQYSYITPTSSISTFSLASNVLTITGTSLPTSIASLTYSNAPCDVTSNSETEIVCTIQPMPVSGQWIPQLKDAFGLIPVTAPAQTLAVTVDSVSPSTDLNPSGYTTLTISGQNFPLSTTDGSSLSVTFADGTACIVSSSASTQIVCVTRAFPQASIGVSQAITVQINGQENSALTATVSASQAQITAVIPNLASPVLKTNLTIQVDPTYALTLNASDLAVTFVLTSDPTQYKLANVIDVDNTNKQIIVRFGGAPSGTYSVTVSSAANGLFNSLGVTLQTIGTITSLSPATGSIYGGQLITISGYNFSATTTDNEVLIGGVDCLLLSSTNDEIQCRTGVRDTLTAGDDTILLSLKASEEATCSAAGDCVYTWTSSGLPVLTAYAASFDTTLNEHVITFTGTGFTGDTSSVQVFIDGYLQLVTAVTATTVTVTVTNITGSASTDLELYFPIGSPSGYSLLTAGITLTPSLVSISPSSGSPAGSLITATVSGVGSGLSGVLSLVDANGVALCSSITIVSYSQIQCQTKAATYSTATTVSFKIGSTAYACANTDATQCQYSTGSSFPAVSTAVVSTDYSEIQFTGTNFYVSGYSANVTYAGVQADSVTITSATAAIATYSLGVPTTPAAVVPALVFVSSTSTVAHWATNMPALSNPYVADNTASTVACSFAGGCLLSVNSRGLATSLQNSLVSNITVCGQLCTVSTADSTSSVAKCSLPAVSTAYSVSNFNITQAGDITELGTTFSSNSLYTYAPFDDDTMNGWPSTTANCYFGVAYPVNYVGFLSQVKFFMNAFTPATYIGLLSFQGSLDGITYTTIFTVGSEIHTGWNYYSYTLDGSEPTYRFFRLFGAGVGSCVVGELVLTGQVAINDNGSTYVCSPVLSLNGTTSTLSTAASYRGTLTPLLASLEPRFGTVKGGTSLTFTGTNFASDLTLYTILVDDVACVPTAATTTSVTCTTSKKTGLIPAATLSIFISGLGQVATQGLTYIYANLWSDTTTWGGEFQPMEGDSVWVPVGLNLLVDVDSTPVLGAVLVEGSLIFPPDDLNSTHQKSFDAYYIFVNGGYMEVGTEQFPYTSKLTITMHGTKESAEIPTFGNKVIGVYQGTLDLHGVARSPTWTELAQTANPGDTSITLNTAVDWQAGEQIVVAATSYNAAEAEQLTIVSVDSTNVNAPVITFTPALLYQHYSAVETYGTQSISMRAEVGLLTRNVLYRGDPETSALNQFGAHIMLHSPGDDSLTGRIENIECYDVGQAYQLGRYPIHFHMIGAVHNSYIRGNAIHQTYNRAVTFHAVSYLRASQNVAYNVMGHTFFVEDAIETNNILEENLVIYTRRSWSLLNTDQTPASYWITNPYNILRNNRAAGSDRYGFWYDLKPNPTGPSYDPTICPDHMPLGEFSGNGAHSNVFYGLWIFHMHIPSTYPCLGATYDATNTTDPYWQNPPVTAEYTGFTAYKNGQCGVMVERMGDVRILDTVTADNLIAGIEISIVDQIKGGLAQVNGALIVGHSQNGGDSETLDSACWGLITTRSDYFSVHNINFYNFDQPGMAALGSCSHCFHPAATDSGARTVTFSGLAFDSSVLVKINYQTPHRDIFYDTDGTLTGLGAGTWATPYWEHNVQPECEVNLSVYDGLICNSDIQVRRLAFYNFAPATISGATINVLQYEDDVVGSLTNVTLAEYLANSSAYSIIPFKQNQNPSNGWAIPFVTNHKYKIHWGTGIDFTSMQCDVSDQWETADDNLNLAFNFTEARARVNFTTGGDLIPNGTLLTLSNALLQTGDNVLYNATDVRLIELLVNGKNSTRSSIVMAADRCIGSCFADIDDVSVENGTRYWSNETSWPNNTLPVEGDDVVIESSWNMVLDLEETPILSSLQINGILTFQQGANITLRAKIIFVRAGILNVGSPAIPYVGTATILLYGNQTSETVVYADNIDTGNKMLANTGRVNMYGQQRSGKVTRLTATANIGDLQITVGTGLDWVAGDKIGIAANTANYLGSDYAVVVSYNAATGVTVLDRALLAYHWGASASTASSYNGVDMRAEVVLLTRNVVIQGTDTQGWGCQFLTSDFLEADGTPRYGRTFLDNVEVYNCSQFDNGKAALRFEGAFGGYSLISNTSVHHGLGWGFNTDSAANVWVEDTVFFNFIQFGVLIQTSSNITLVRNIVLHVDKRTVTALDEFVDKVGGFAICAYTDGDICSTITVTGNIVGGAYFYGFVAPGHTCGDYSGSAFKNNVAHSIQGNGVFIYPDPTNSQLTTCLEGSFFAAYKCAEAGAVTFSAVTQAIFSYMTLIDNAWSAVVDVGVEADSLSAQFRHSLVYGETAAHDCPTANYCNLGGTNADLCFDKIGFTTPYFQKMAKSPYPTMSSQLPIAKIGEDASWGGASNIKNITFISFLSNTTFCGQRQSAFAFGPEMADYIPVSYYDTISLVNVDQDALAYLYSPPTVWAVVDDCGETACTAPANTLLSFTNVRYSGTTSPDRQLATFQIVPNAPLAVQAFTYCTFYSAWNAYQCQDDYLGILLFESLDTDRYGRTFSPMVITDLAGSFENALNEFMDHLWDSFYTSQLRLSRFPTIIQTGASKLYSVSYTGTPPDAQRFQLIAQNGALTASITYPKAGTHSVSDSNNNLITANAWDDSINGPARIKGVSCGENRYTGVNNTLQFYITPGCLLYINPVDAIQGRIRLSWTLAAFFSSGSSSFVDRFASVLNIAASSIKIVNVYEGSVQIQYSISDTTTNSAANLAAIQTRITNLIQSGGFGTTLGAAVLDGDFGDTTSFVQASSDSTATTSSPSTTPSTSTSTSGGSTTSTSQGGSSSSSNSSSGSSNGGLSGAAKIAIIVSLIVLFAVVAVGVGIFVYRKHKADSMAPVKTADFGSVRSDRSGQNHEDDVYEPQYHPKAELGNIFGSGLDAEKQRQKMNKADQVNEEDEEVYSPDKLFQPTEGEDEDDVNHSKTDQSMVGVSNMHNAHESDLIKNMNMVDPGTLRQKDKNDTTFQIKELQGSPSHAL